MSEAVQENQDFIAELTPPGAMLKNAREALGLSQESVARALRFKRVMLQDIENDHYDAFHSKMYLKGYLKAYAKFVEISVDQVLQAFAATGQSQQTRNNFQVPLEDGYGRKVGGTDAPTKKTGQSPKMIITVVAAIVGAAVIGFMINQPQMAHAERTSILSPHLTLE